MYLPPYKNQILRALVAYQMKHPEIPLYAFGDFNNYTDQLLDKHPPVVGGRGVNRTALRKFIEEVGWKDPWRAKNPGVRQFSCFSKSYSSLLRIDLCLCSCVAERYISEVAYALRSVLDHSPLIVVLEVRPPSTVAKAPSFWRIHATDESMAMNWEAFKAVLRSLFITEIQAIKRKTHAQREGIECMAEDLESKFIADPTQTNKEASAAERKRFFHKAVFYEEGEHTERLLATIAHSHQTSPSIGALHTHLGGLTNSPDQILSELVGFYSSLYESKQTYSSDSLSEYLDTFQLPSLTAESKAALDAPLTIEELQMVTSLFPSSKARETMDFPLRYINNMLSIYFHGC